MIDFNASKPPKSQRLESGMKVEVAGHTLPGPRKKQKLMLNGLQAKTPLPDRLRAWINAFKRVNHVSVQFLQSLLVEELRSLPAKVLGKNGSALKSGDAGQWLGVLGARQFMKPSKRKDPRHFDGGASFVHIGLTIYGRRTVFTQSSHPS